MADGTKSLQVLVEDDADAVVVCGAVKVVFNANGGIDVYSHTPVTIHAAAEERARPAAAPPIAVGDVMPDGTKYAGISPDTGRAMYAAPADAPLMMKWREAMDYAARGEPSGAFRLPTRGELNALFHNRAEIGGFNEVGSELGVWYWSSASCGSLASGQRFSDGYRNLGSKNIRSSVRLVRS